MRERSGIMPFLSRNHRRVKYQISIISYILHLALHLIKYISLLLRRLCKHRASVLLARSTLEKGDELRCVKHPNHPPNLLLDSWNYFLLWARQAEIKQFTTLVVGSKRQKKSMDRMADCFMVQMLLLLFFLLSSRFDHRYTMIARFSFVTAAAEMAWSPETKATVCEVAKQCRRIAATVFESGCTGIERWAAREDGESAVGVQMRRETTSDISRSVGHLVDAAEAVVVNIVASAGRRRPVVDCCCCCCRRRPPSLWFDVWCGDERWWFRLFEQKEQILKSKMFLDVPSRTLRLQSEFSLFKTWHDDFLAKTVLLFRFYRYPRILVVVDCFLRV